MKKALKILLIVILILITIIIGYYSYLKIQIKREEKRLKIEESELMKPDTDSKYLVVVDYHNSLAISGVGSKVDYYEIDFEKKSVVKKIKETSGSVAFLDSKSIIEKKQRLEYLKKIKIAQKQSSKILTDDQVKELKLLLDDIIENRVERIKLEETPKIGNIPNKIETYKISTKNKKDIEFDNKELINKFLNLVK